MKKFVLALSLAVGLVLPFSVVTAFANAPESTEQPPVTINYADDDCVYSSQIKIEDVSLNDTDFTYPSSVQKSFTAYINSSVVGDFSKITWLEQDTALPESFLLGNDGNIEPVAAGNVISLYVNSGLFGTATVRIALTYPVLNEVVTYEAVDGGVNVTLTGAILNGETLMVSVGGADAVAYDVPVAVDGTYTIFVAYDFPVGNTEIKFEVIPLCEVDADEHPAVIASVTVNVAEVIIITADPDEVDFGSAIEGYTDIAPIPVTFKNDGNVDAELMLNGDGKFVFGVVETIWDNELQIDLDVEGWVDYTTITVPANGQKVVTIRPAAGLAPDEYELTLVHNDAPYCTITFEVTAVQSAEISAAPATVEFGSATVDYDDIDAVEVTFTNSGNIAGTVTFYGDDAFELLVEGQAWDGNVPVGSIVVSISPKANLPVGEYTLNLGDYCTITFVVTAVQYADITADQDAVDFGSATVDYTAIKAVDVIFTNSGNIDGTVSFVGDDAFDLLVEGVVWNGTVSAGGSVTVSISPKVGLSVDEYELVLGDYCTISFVVTEVELVSYNIVFMVDDEVYKKVNVPDNCVPYTINVTAPTKVDFKFAGWMLGEEVVSGFDANYYPDGGIVTLVADWDPIVSEPSTPEFDVEATGNTGEIKIWVTNPAVPNDSGLTLQRYSYRVLYASTGKVVTGYGWSAIPLASANGFIVSGLVDATDYIVEYRAIFTGSYFVPAAEGKGVTPYSTYSIVFMLGDEEYYVATVKNSSAWDIEAETGLDEPSDPDFIFVGWLLDGATFNGKFVAGYIPANGVVTLVADLIDLTVSYNISWYFDGGSVTGDPASSYTYGTVITFPTVTKSGYTIKGWNVDGELITASTCELNMTGNITIEAVFAKAGAEVTEEDYAELKISQSEEVKKVGNYGVLNIALGIVNVTDPDVLSKLSVTTSNAAVVKVYYDSEAGLFMYQSLKSGTAMLKLYYQSVQINSWNVTVKA